ncbi:MAG: ABC transporter permease [Candidatus Kariarchaeaceae archaeon]|jgi:ABC-2 type transport system permease protein
MSSKHNLDPIEEINWKRGFTNILKIELSSWFKTKKWLKHILIWLLVINLILFFTTLDGGEEEPVDPEEEPQEPNEEFIMLYSIFSGLWPALGVIIIANSIIIGEKKSGTAAWILSKPITRKSFILAKLISNTIGAAVTMILAPGILAYLQYGLEFGKEEGWLSPINFLLALIVILISTLLYLSFTLLMGTYYDDNTSVLGTAFLAYLLLFILTSFLPAQINPLMITLPGAEDDQSLATAIIFGKTMTANLILPLITAIVLNVLFFVFAIKRFEKEEL